MGKRIRLDFNQKQLIIYIVFPQKSFFFQHLRLLIDLVLKFKFKINQIKLN